MKPLAPSVPPREILTTEQAAELLGVAPKTLCRMAVPYLTVGHATKRPRRRYLREQVMEWCRKRAAT